MKIRGPGGGGEGEVVWRNYRVRRFMKDYLHRQYALGSSGHKECDTGGQLPKLPPAEVGWGLC